MCKRGVALYKEIKSTAGDVTDVLADLKKQFGKLVNPTPEQKKQYNDEVKRVQEVAKTHPQDALNSIWDQLGNFIDEYDRLSKAFIEEEANARKLYKGSESLARRALRRVQIRTQLDASLSEVRTLMVYNTPAELSDVYTRWEKMWTQIVAEQNEALAEELRKNQVIAWQRKRTINQLKALAVWIGAVLFVTAWMWGVLIMLRMSRTYQSLLFYVSP